MAIRFLMLISLLFCATVVAQAATYADKVIVGYWGVWDSKPLPINYIPWTQITHLNFGFATVNEDHVPALNNRGALMSLVNVAHANNVKVLLSIGGWYGSKKMDEMVSDEKNRQACVSIVKRWVHEFDLDGVDIIDWRTRHPCNRTAATTEDHLFPLLQQLRMELGIDKLLTLGVGATPFQYSNVSSYQQVLDWVTVMAHDIHVSTPTLGANSPLYKNDASTSSVVEAWGAWSAMPMHQLVLGIPLYGYASKPVRDRYDDDLSSLTGPVHSTRPHGDADDPMLPEPCKHGFSGLWRWRSLRNTGILLDESTPGPHWAKHWDTSSQTPWLYNSLSHIVISYDDPESIKLKATFALCQHARGISVSNLAYDYYSAGNGQLLSAIQGALNNSNPQCGWSLAHANKADPADNAATPQRDYPDELRLILLLVMVFTL